MKLDRRFTHKHGDFPINQKKITKKEERKFIKEKCNILKEIINK